MRHLKSSLVAKLQCLLVVRPSTSPSLHMPRRAWTKGSFKSDAKPTKQSAPTHPRTSSMESGHDKMTAAGRSLSWCSMPSHEQKLSPHKITGSLSRVELTATVPVVRPLRVGLQGREEVGSVRLTLAGGACSETLLSRPRHHFLAFRVLISA
jgi:hypothetical protein